MIQNNFRKLALVVSVAFLATASQVAARGGHGMRGFGGMGHRGLSSGLTSLTITPAYVIINASKIEDEKAFRTATDDLSSTVATFSGRIVADVDKPLSWEGDAPVHLLMIEFSTSDQAQAWKDSEAFKNFDAAGHRGAELQIELVQGLPVPANSETARAGRGRFRIDQRAYEPIVKEYDQTLSKMHGICKGC
ncbi:DUF1330 domain-containing protein [Bradyrhizobium erythrophlei]|uniref:Uncharacterized conserved protein, DUF1330 family n=1 Tax=Bradyrhizobium erythrophlei TaxID=1437360 RepID=A0A1M7U5Q5_9BRAD|nr:DUF1330 domain-containing protein [Bradyrhizobium erythrophlei]SHN78190.1 Uncharacterized conserved protein, DUF1330 family [Bradyrhizobium erythrophlei]